MNEKAIQQLVKSRGWQELVKMLNDKIIKANYVSSVDTKGLTDSQIALEVKSKQEATKLLVELIDDINRIGNKQEVKKESWI